MFMYQKIPETEIGLPLGTTDRFISEIRHHRINLHSLLLIKDNKLFCEKYAPGFNADFKHRMYSVSKTFVSAAVGCAIEDGYFTLDSHIADFFKDKCPEKLHPYIKNLTVRDCLTMSTPFNETPYKNTHTDWVYDFFNATATHRGGSLFHYDTGATLVLNELVGRVTGKPFQQYLYEKVLKYIGFSSVPECVTTPDGIPWGGSGIFCTSRELARFALVWINNGKAPDGRQLIPEWYVKEATSKQIGNAEDNTQNYLRGYGYGYQIWRIKTGWAMFGMGNQLALYSPKENLLLVCTGDDQGNDFARATLIELMEDMLLCPLGGNYNKEYPSELGMPLPVGEKNSPFKSLINGVKYITEPNKTGIEWVKFDFSDDEGEMEFFARGEIKKIHFGIGKYTEGVFPEENYSGITINKPLNRGYRCFASAIWDLPDLLLLKCYAADMYFGVMTVNVRFCENGIDMHFTKTAEWFFDEYCGFLTGTRQSRTLQSRNQLIR